MNMNGEKAYKEVGLLFIMASVTRSDNKQAIVPLTRTTAIVLFVRVELLPGPEAVASFKFLMLNKYSMF